MLSCISCKQHEFAITIKCCVKQEYSVGVHVVMVSEVRQRCRYIISNDMNFLFMKLKLLNWYYNTSPITSLAMLLLALKDPIAVAV